tara:strand:+ start:114 stop:803 length:690 start_codon:yes stop_codon:yes gene_type:complete
MLRKVFTVACTLGGSSALHVRPTGLRPLAQQPTLRSVRMMCDAAAAPVAEAPAAPPEGPPPFAELDVRVGKIVEAWMHPDSEKLWCEKIDVGEKDEEGNPVPREIASGLRAYYPTKEDMEGQAVLVVCNLKAAKLGGFPSNGMVLCAASEDGKVEFVEPPAESEPGERVVCGDMMVAPAGGNRVQKKKLMQKAAEELRAIDNVACYQGVPLTTAAGKCTSPTIAAGTIN